MKHWSASLLHIGLRLVRRRARSAAFALALPALAACGDGRTALVVLSDTTAAAAARVVVALPFDPAALPDGAAEAIPGGPAGDSVRLGLARRDSAVLLDAAFQRARAAANERARALAGIDRRSADYARRFAAWTALADSTEELRRRRDAVTRRLHALRALLGARAGVLGGAPSTLPRSAADSAARTAGRGIAEAVLTSGSATLDLSPGDWWIAPLAPDGALRLPAVKQVVVGGVRDTVDVR